MRISIMQPAYLPWAGYIQRIMRSDAHIVLDHVKIDWHSKTQFTNRNRILTPHGALWLTLPLRKMNSDAMLINDIKLNNNTPWQKKHAGSLRQNYAKTPFYNEQQSFWTNFYSRDFDLLTDAIENSTAYLLRLLGCSTPVLKSSSMKAYGTKAELILNLCREAGATTYISGPFGREYLDLAQFEQAGIKVIFHDFTPLPYSQTQPGFTPYLSVVDMIFNIGPDAARKLLMEEGQAS